MLALGMLVAVSSVRAQETHGELQSVNGEWERYWRVLQIGGDVPEHPWGSRPFGPAELTRLHARGHHPWASRATRKAFRMGRVHGTTLPLELRTIFNSDFPFGFNEGPVWAGRGLTSVVRGGAAFAIGPVSGSLAPLFFQAQNTSFPLLDNGFPGRFAFGLPYPFAADLPQRFGDRPYRLLHPGNSFLRLDAGPAAAGFATSPQHWGPARDHPLVLGSNAGGFPHAFLGTARPVRLGPIRIHGKAMWGKLSQSRYVPIDTIARSRLASGIVVLVVPVALPGLELGASRFVHILWSDDVLNPRNLTRPFAGLLGAINTGAANQENHVASIFGRWVFPSSGVEAYGEFAREDGNLSWRHLMLEPDHASGYMVGLQRAWGGAGRGAGDSAGGSVRREQHTANRTVVRMEVLNTRSTTVHLIPVQNPFYVHSPISQGHTYLGQALGSAGGFGGGAGSIAFDRYTPSGRWSVTWTRLMRAEFLTNQLGWVPVPQQADVFHALGLDGILFRGRTAFTYELTGVYEFNRNFERDAFNLRMASGVRWAW